MASELYNLYVAIYEYKGRLIPGLTRQFMRHTSVLIEVDESMFDTYHVTGTPGIGLTYSCPRQWNDPRTHTARLLTMPQIAKVEKKRYEEIAELAKSIPIVTSRDWNCQDWVRALLSLMAEKGLITNAEKDDAYAKMATAINSPFTTETPNRAALEE
ncbi:hypothetical protein EJ08DRAFT_651743 [Tothia fuscella]|uniref:Uncharacterized protein n=1 Tax=Tothia fuscella TaxID=1048955 RepID=A0A9P4NM02_9PEZI|nr:hypothetical protein EJ08DRAFT_651743 [Tothia fuscella]